MRVCVCRWLEGCRWGFFATNIREFVSLNQFFFWLQVLIPLKRAIDWVVDLALQTSVMKPKSSTASKAATLTEPFEDDKQGLVAHEDGGPKVLTQRECDSFDKKLHPFDSDSGLRRLRARRPKRASSFVALCLYFSFFCLGLFTALFITSFQTDFLRWYFSCVHLKVESNEGFTPQAVPQGHLMDFIAAAPPASSAACPDSCTWVI